MYVDINETDNTGANALFLCSGDNSNLEVFRYLLKLGVELESCKEKSILHYAIEHNNNEITNYLVSKFKKKYINLYDSKGGTPLHYLIFSSDNINMLDYMITNGADVNIKTKDETGDSILHLAVGFGKTEFVEYLLKNKLVKDINENNKKLVTPLHQAFLYNDDTIILEMLLKHGADYSKLTCEGNTILHLAAINNKQCILKYIFYFHN